MKRFKRLFLTAAWIFLAQFSFVFADIAPFPVKPEPEAEPPGTPMGTIALVVGIVVGAGAVLLHKLRKK